MRQRLYIPDKVKQSIAKHVKAAIERAVDGYTSGEEDEDTLTGDLGGNLRIRTQSVFVEQDELQGEWKWSINYYKFRGRGKNATESFLGADGIFELILDRGFRTERKTVLFQCKKEWHDDPSLLSQCIKLSTWREAEIVINFTPASYEEFALDDVILSRGKNGKDLKTKLLAEVLGHEFPDCLVGDTELSYDAATKKLIWRASKGEIISTSFKVKHRVKIKVQTPKHSPGVKVDKDIANGEIHGYRMMASEEEMLSLQPAPNRQQVEAAYKTVALTYHPDKFTGIKEIKDLEKAILTRRMQEMNNARDHLRKPRK